MGFNTTIMILNDQWHSVKKNPEKLIEDIDAGMNGINRMRGTHDGSEVDSFIGQTTVHTSYHADESPLFLGGGNVLLRLQAYSRTTEAYYYSHPEYVRRQVAAAKEQIKSVEKWLDTIDRRA